MCKVDFCSFGITNDVLLYSDTTAKEKIPGSPDDLICIFQTWPLGSLQGVSRRPP